MKKYYVFILLGFILIFSSLFIVNSTPNTKLNTLDSNDYTTISNNTIFNSQKFWNDKNLSLLSDEQKTQLDIIMQKSRIGESLTKDEKDTLWSLKELVFKSKLSKESFMDFISLMDKRHNGNRLNEGEIERLNQYYKLVKENYS